MIPNGVSFFKNAKEKMIDLFTFPWSSFAKSLNIAGIEVPSVSPDGIVWLYMWNSPYITLAVAYVCDLIRWQMHEKN